uniref:MACPF domain-containing protein n=1 Tax=Branchiostoma floridae TaxID=7739 RepID=C3ZTY9_BRAFL|eukprot:XP_002588020.1 hypothetical protein BRAFLDRAFT_89006 [Branchiostoma floridae]
MKKAAAVGVPLVLLLAVSVALSMTLSRDTDPSQLKHRFIKRSTDPSELPDGLHDILRAAAAEDAPKYVPRYSEESTKSELEEEDLADALRAAMAEDNKAWTHNKRFLGAIAKLAGDIVGKAKTVLPKQLSETINKLGGMKNMGADLMSDSVKKQQEMTAEVEKEVADKTIQNLFSQVKKGDSASGQTGGSAGGQTVGSASGKKPDPAGAKKAAPSAGGTGEMKAEIDFVEQKGMVQDDLFAPPGMKMKVDVQKSPKKQNEKDDMSPPPAFSYPVGMGGTLMNGCFGTGYKRGDPCYKAKRPIPPCQASVNAAWGGSSKFEKQMFMSLIETDVIRYEIFLDEITPDSLSLSFLRDFLSLPKNFILGKAKLQDFIIRYGTHFIKSAKFGGSFRLFKTQEAAKSESLTSFSVSAQASYSGMFSAGGHYGRNEESGSASSSKSASTHIVVEGGDQKVASIVADFYTTSFKDTFTEWLKSIPSYPKPIQMFMGTMSELLNLNFKLLFPFDMSDAADGCFSKNLLTEEGTARKYYNVPVLVEDNNGNETTKNEKRYCDDATIEEFQLSMDKKRLALERAIAVYMEEGPIPTTDFHLKGGNPGCQTEALTVKGGDTGVAHPSWLDLINGDTYKIFFDLQKDINSDIKKNTEAYVVYSENRWNCHAPGESLHVYNSHTNGGSSDTNKMKYLDKFPRNIVNAIVARAEYISPLEHSQSNSGALASILEAPCNVKWSNSYQIKPAEEGGRCLYFVAASEGDIFVVFSAIPRDKTTWYHLQISFQGVALYKGMKLVKYEGAKSARSLGDSKLFQPYFICIEEDMDGLQTHIKYGIGSDSSEKGLIYMVFTDDAEPLGIQFYSFGSGEKNIEIMDARIIEGGNAGQMECTGGTIMVDGKCMEDCHPECNGCIPRSPGSKLDTECRMCKHVAYRRRDGTTQCLAECPTGLKTAKNGVTCTCQYFAMRTDDERLRCIPACPPNHAVDEDGMTCIPNWRDDRKCGQGFAAPGVNPGECDPAGVEPCCSSLGWCGASPAHCTCEGCTDFRWLKRDSFRIVGSKGNPHVWNGVASDPQKTLDGNLRTFWNPGGLPQNYNNWYIVYDLGAPITLDKIAINNIGDQTHDVTSFKLLKSEKKMPWQWYAIKDGTGITPGTQDLMLFSYSKETAQYWLFIVKSTYSGYQPWLSEVKFHGFHKAVNIAEGKEVSQTSTDSGEVAERAVDGNIDTDPDAESCTKTTQEDDPTWFVDLGGSYKIRKYVYIHVHVVIFNNDDRINPFNIHIGESEVVASNHKCGGDHRYIRGTEESISMNVPCADMQGRFVAIRAPGRGRVLSLCEVHVFSDDLDGGIEIRG